MPVISLTRRLKDTGKDACATLPTMNRRKKIGIGCAVVAVGLGAWLGPALFDMREYITVAVSPQQMREYDGTNADNLKAIHTALMLYEESEGAFPEAEGWMDAIENRIRASDMTEEQAAKKFRDPRRSKAADQYGYAFNEVISKQYHGDIKDPATTPLVFISTDMGRNAHGDPAEIGEPVDSGRPYAVAVDGTILRKP